MIHLHEDVMEYRVIIRASCTILQQRFWSTLVQVMDFCRQELYIDCQLMTICEAYVLLICFSPAEYEEPLLNTVNNHYWTNFRLRWFHVHKNEMKLKYNITAPVMNLTMWLVFQIN